MSDKPKPFTIEEIRNRREKRAERRKLRNVGEIKIRRNRAKTRDRYCVSMTPAMAAFYRMEYGKGSLSVGLEEAGKILLHIKLSEKMRK